MVTNPQPAELTHQAHEDDSIASVENRHHQSSRKGGSSTHKSTSIPRSGTKTPRLLIPPAPRDIARLDEWLFEQFKETLQVNSILDINDLLIYTLRVDTYDDLRKLVGYTPHTYLCKLGAEVYDASHKLLSELSIILHYVFDQWDHKEDTGLWDYDEYLAHRLARLQEVGGRFPLSFEILAAYGTPQPKMDTPPPYTADSATR